jgi:hypothetical protein
MNDPVLIAVTGRKRKNGRISWTRVGRAYPHDKGSGLTLVLDVKPNSRRIYLRELDEMDWDRLIGPPAN